MRMRTRMRLRCMRRRIKMRMKIRMKKKRRRRRKIVDFQKSGKTDQVKRSQAAGCGRRRDLCGR